MFFRANQACFMNKVLKKAIMKRSQRRGAFLKRKQQKIPQKTLESKLAYKEQRNSLQRKEEQN